jgi:S-adenosyl-L-methionine hydrolase (adenosine-forming)
MTDFGQGDGDVGVMKGVIANITPHAHIIDVTHEVSPQNVASGAWILAASYRFFPKDSVFVCVVDPGVGSSRGAIAAHAGDWYFVGPDNGLFSYIYAQQSVHRAVMLSNAAYHLPHVSSTFHGRDLFAPAGAYLARGVAIEELGASLDAFTLQRLDRGIPERVGMHIEAQVIHIDRFGNVITTIPLSLVPDLFTSPRVQLTFPPDSVVIEARRRFFAEGPLDSQPFIYGDSSGYVGLAVRNGNAARTLGVSSGSIIICEIV